MFFLRNITPLLNKNPKKKLKLVLDVDDTLINVYDSKSNNFN